MRSRKLKAMSHRFALACSMMAARNCHADGLSVKQIAAQAHKSTTTIRRWLK